MSASSDRRPDPELPPLDREGERDEEVIVTGFGRMRGLARRRPSSIWFATAALFLLSWIVSSGSVSSVAIQSMLPFAGILAIAAVGQTLVVQQRGIDLSVPGMMTLAAVLASQFPNEHGGSVWSAIAVTIGVAVAVGIVNGLVVARLNVTPLVATLAMNALLTGIVLQYSGGTPPKAPRELSSFALDHTLGIPNTVVVALVFVAAVAFVVSYTSWGRRFVAVGANPRAARASGVAVHRYHLAAYVAAALCYSAAGLVLAGYVNTPSITSGDAYLLPSIAAVVVGGTAFTGGRGYIVGTAVGAVFLSQLTQLVLSLGAETSVQLLIQSLVIAVAAAMQTIDRSYIADVVRALRGRVLRSSTSATA